LFIKSNFIVIRVFQIFKRSYVIFSQIVNLTS